MLHNAPAVKPLKTLTSFRIGGEPLFYFKPQDYTSLAHALRLCCEANIEYRILGGGSNLLVDDSELDFGVIHICSPGFNWIKPASDENTLTVGGGVTLGSMLSFCRKNGHGGAEFLAGIPGTLGGAIAGNAGAWGLSVESLLKSIVAVDREGARHRLARKDIRFSYRSAGLEGLIITEAQLELPPRSPELVSRQIRKNLEKKRKSQPTGRPNAGCIFKNPGNESAGKLLDICGFKGWQLGGARVSEAHANFICNHRKAEAGDVFRMIEEMKRTVKEKFGIELELEVKLWKRAENAKVA